MNATDCNARLDNATESSDILAEPVTLQAVVRQIRICRSTLGAILDVLETAELGQESVERAAESSINVMLDIERLWKALN